MEYLSDPTSFSAFQAAIRTPFFRHRLLAGLAPVGQQHPLNACPAGLPGTLAVVAASLFIFGQVASSQDRTHKLSHFRLVDGLACFILIRSRAYIKGILEEGNNHSVDSEE